MRNARNILLAGQLSLARSASDGRRISPRTPSLALRAIVVPGSLIQRLDADVLEIDLAPGVVALQGEGAVIEKIVFEAAFAR